jgi:hypothetical protein
MATTRYEIVEKDRHAQDAILSTLVREPTHGVAYMFMMTGEPLSATDITAFLSLSDAWLTNRFNDAVGQLCERGLIRVVSDDDL